MAISHGPVDSVNRIYVGKRILSPTILGGGLTVPIIANSTTTFIDPALLGGSEKEGGIVADIDWEFGGSSQTVNTYLSSQFGAGVTPAFRGVTCAVFRKTAAAVGGAFISPSGGGYLTAMTPYPKPWAFEVTDIPGGTFNITKQKINPVSFGGVDISSANGGHIIHDALTNTDWGLGYPEAELDSASFTTATDTLHAEGFGLSLVYTNQSTMEEFIQQILTHINGVLYPDRQTGKFKLVLIRDDFTAATLPIFNETNIAALQSFERPAFAEMVNEIVIKYRKRGDLEDKSISSQDLASIQAQEGIVSQTSEFPGIDSDDIAGIVAARELKQLSTPLAKVRFVANREAWDVNPGDVVKFSWTVLGISEIIVRVISVDYGSLENGLVGVDAIEDVFGLPINEFTTPSDTGWADEIAPPVAANNAVITEFPFFIIQTTLPFDITSVLDSDDAFLQSSTEPPTSTTFNMRLNTRIGANDFVEVATGIPTPTAQLVSTLDRATKTSISIDTILGNVGAVEVGSFAYIGNEVVRVDLVNLTTNVVNLGRGYMDTVPLSHAANSVIFFADGNSVADPTLYTTGDSVDSKVQTQTSVGILPLASAPTINHLMTGRQNKPYNAAQIKIAGLFFPATLIDQISVLVTWTHQDRTQQLVVGGSDWFETSLGAPEAGVTYTVRYFNNTTATLLNTDSGITGTSSSFTPNIAVSSTITMRVEVEAVRDTFVSEFLFSHIFSYTRPLGVRALENGDIRVLENADRRVLD